VPTLDRTVARAESFHPHLTLGAVGCALSHRHAWVQVVQDAMPAVVLEDDAAVCDGFAARVAAVLAALPQTFDFVYLGWHGGPRMAPGAGTAAPPQVRPYAARDGLMTGLFGYLVSPKGARALLDATRFLHTQLDVQLSNYFAMDAVYVLDAGVLVQSAESASDVQTLAGTDNWLPHTNAPDEYHDRFL
jgi:GR25 family glycosyltransferase involved in LPS biosynthesis